jgi:hypothetical protein
MRPFNKRLEPTRLAHPVYSWATRRAAQAQRLASVAFMADVHKSNRLCGRFSRFIIILVLCLVGLYVGIALLFFGPLAWPIAGLWLFGAGWVVVRLGRRFRLYDHGA